MLQNTCFSCIFDRCVARILDAAAGEITTCLSSVNFTTVHCRIVSTAYLSAPFRYLAYQPQRIASR